MRRIGGKMSTATPAPRNMTAPVATFSHWKPQRTFFFGALSSAWGLRERLLHLVVWPIDFGWGFDLKLFAQRFVPRESVVGRGIGRDLGLRCLWFREPELLTALLAGRRATEC